MLCREEQVTVLITPKSTSLRKYLVHMMVEMQFGVGKCSQIYDALSACNKGFTQSVIKTEQVGLSGGHDGGSDDDDDDNLKDSTVFSIN
jgi:hypothetical protein